MMCWLSVVDACVPHGGCYALRLFRDGSFHIHGEINGQPTETVYGYGKWDGKRQVEVEWKDENPHGSAYEAIWKKLVHWKRPDWVVRHMADVAL